MSKWIRHLAHVSSEVRRAYLARLVSIALVGCLLLATGMNTASGSEALGQAIRQRIEATDQTDRPKTTGEFLDEARGDVPLDERLKNITRDSKEAFKKLGEEYTPDLDQTARDLQNKAGQIGRDLKGNLSSRTAE
jgi:hypothetical protein